ncbi:hypothetical protein [Phaeobacter inhibens]|uniref:hypothetical protein n=1 Tax=Phaeobacter inhibens TaxID=221822 RepID=UPI0021A5E5E8|nr:hypothetical protein [Phaeobacter inhibens]
MMRSLPACCKVSLEQAGHFPIICEDATETIAQYKEYDFDLVITDLIVKKTTAPYRMGA